MIEVANSPAGGGGGAADGDEKVKVSSNDTTAGYLNGKLVAGTNITLTEGSDGGNETLTVAASGGVTGFTGSQNTSSPNNTVNASRLLVDASSTNADAVLQPKGTGAVLAQLPDSTSTGGNKRGANAVDLQTNRTAAAQVASGAYATIGGGRVNTASGSTSTVAGGVTNTASNTSATVGGGDTNTASGVHSTVAGGFTNTASSTYATAFGERCTAQASNATSFGGPFNDANAAHSVCTGTRANALSLHGARSHSAGRISADGDAQILDLCWRATLTSDSATEIYLDGSSARAVVPSGRLWNVDLQINYSDSGFNHFVARRYLAITRLSTTTALVGTVETIGTDKAASSTPTISITADDTNESLKIEVTRVSGQTGYVSVTARINQSLRV